MITNKDIIKLKETFATKDDLNSTNNVLQKLSDKTDQGFAWMIEEFGKVRSEMATKDDLKNFATKDDLKKFATKSDLDKFVTKSDLTEIMGELRAIREELTVGTYRRLEISETIESHQTRISTLRKQTFISQISYSIFRVK